MHKTQVLSHINKNASLKTKHRNSNQHLNFHDYHVNFEFIFDSWENYQKLKKELYEIISVHSGKPYDDVWRDSDRDFWMTAEESKAYGMIDEVLVKNKGSK